MKNIFIFLLLLLIFSCKQTTQQKINTVLNKHLQPSSHKLNTLSIGQTIVFEYSETEGIDRSKYPAPKYEKNVDTLFFSYLKTEVINDGSNGGQTYYFNIYKAIKKGNTKITMRKTTFPQNLANDTIIKNHTTALISTYNFTIN